MLQDIFDRIDRGENLSEEDAVELLQVPNLSPDYYRILQKASELSQKIYQGKGYLFVQIGLNAEPCSGNCSFCSLAAAARTHAAPMKKTREELLSVIDRIDFTRVTAVFLMTTADYDPEEFLEMGAAVRSRIPDEIALVANTSDFGRDYADRLREAGFTGAYHIVRLREGIDTEISVQQRILTLDAIRDSGLRLYYCLEPVGPEHTCRELAVEMIRAREYHVEVMAAMRRVGVPGTPYENQPSVDEIEMTKIVAVTRLVSMPAVSMNIHEPFMTAMLAGVNQLYAEIGANPRDVNPRTEFGRGFSVDEAARMLEAAGCRVCIEERK